MQKNIEYAMAYSKVKGLGGKTLCKYKDTIYDLKNDDAAYLWLLQICDMYKRIDRISKEAFLSLCDNAHRTLQEQEKQGIESVSFRDAYYPDGFKELDDPPLYFFVKGNKEALKKKGIAVIGTRQVTSYSQQIGVRFGEVLAEKGWSVVSGLAIGCDSAGHTGCLKGNGITVAIVATPLDQVYPKQNAGLQEEILNNNGCVISEYSLGEKFSPYNLVTRDRLQSGMAQGVIVVATGLKGGTYHAINTAEKLKKPVGCFSYSDDYYKKDSHALGNQKMIQSDRAVPLCDTESIERFLAMCGSAKSENEDAVQLSLFL